MFASSPEPAVSVVLPTYNRAHFLPQAFDSLRAQTWGDWELIVVDDGSRDDSAAVVERLAPGLIRPVRYILRENGGPAAARNTGIDLARGKYLAFFDSDDCWLPHHLAASVAALESAPEVEWVFSAARRVNYHTGEVLIPHTFYQGDYPARFLNLRTRRVGALNVLDDPGVLRCTLRGANFGGLQATVVRRGVFSRLRLEPVGFFEDRLAVIRAAALGVRFGYLDDVHVILYSHDANVSFASDKQVESRLAAMSAYVAALEALGRELPLSQAEAHALRAKRGEEAFWNMGYFLARRGRYRDGLRWMRYGLRCRPGNLRFWKTYLATRARAIIGSSNTGSERTCP
jgi:glycosyltransferase involved in cell wall biosynthesis